MTIYNIMGWGKGKTTSAIGITARALMNNEKVLFCQFLKDGKDSGVRGLKYLDSCICPVEDEYHFMHIYQGTKGFEISNCTAFWNKCMKAIDYFNPDLVIFDELNVALDYGLFDINSEDMVSRIKQLGIEQDIYITGRINNYKLRHQMIEMADIATNCYCEAHNYNLKCSKCGMEFPEEYLYCPACGSKLTQRTEARKGREC